jgi:hypothetical protein
MNVYDLFSASRYPDKCTSPGSAPPDPRLPGSGLAHFWQLREKRVFEAGGVRWGQYKGPFYVSLPFHLQLDPEPGEIESVLRRHGAPAAWFPSVNHAGLSCGMYVCLPAGYGLDAIDRKKRKQVREGLENCEMRRVDLEELRVEGIGLNRQTMERQGRYDPEFGDTARWSHFVDAISRCPEIDVTGAYVNGRLSAYIVGCLDDGWLHLLYKMSRSEDMAEYTNAALDFTVLSAAGRDPSIRAVGNWFGSFLSNPGLDRYKRQMGYTVVPNQMCVFFHPAAAPLLANKLTVRVFQTAASLRPRSKQMESIARMSQGAMLSQNYNHATGSATESPCQQEHNLRFSRLLRPYPVFLVWRFFDRLKTEGLRQVIGRTVRFAGKRIFHRNGPKKAVARKPLGSGEALGLQPEEWVEVRSEAEILATLDGQSKHRGLLFSVEMRRFCGRRFRVLKPVRKIFLEESKQTRVLKNTVLLEGVHCDGTGFDCDRSCFLFWREAWLRRADPPPANRQRLTEITLANVN